MLTVGVRKEIELIERMYRGPAPDDGLDVARGVLVGIVLGFAFWSALVAAAVVLR